MSNVENSLEIHNVNSIEICRPEELNPKPSCKYLYRYIYVYAACIRSILVEMMNLWNEKHCFNQTFQWKTQKQRICAERWFIFIFLFSFDLYLVVSQNHDQWPFYMYRLLMQFTSNETTEQKKWQLQTYIIHLKCLT